MHWNGFAALQPGSAFFNGGYDGSGFETGLTSGDQLAGNSNGATATVSLGGTFDLKSVELTAGWDTKLKVEIVGYKGNGEKVYDKTFTLSDSGPTLATLNLKGVDQVDFVPLKGSHDPALQGNGPYIAFDDFLFKNVAPAVQATHLQAGAAFDPVSHHAFGAGLLVHMVDPLHGMHPIA